MAPFLMYVGISLLYASVAGALVSFVEPLAAGSGIAEVKTYLNGIHIRGLLAVSTSATAISLQYSWRQAGCMATTSLPLSTLGQTHNSSPGDFIAFQMLMRNYN